MQLTGRTRVTVWRSTDGGRSYPDKRLVDGGLSAQTSLQMVSGRLVMLYEQADPAPMFTFEDIIGDKAVQDLRVLIPNRFVFREFEF